MEGERKRSEKESSGDGFKLLVSQADIGSSAAWLSFASHTISPLFAISPLSFLLHLPPWRSDSQCDALHHSAASDTVYIIPSHSFSHSLKKKCISLTHSLFFLTHTLSYLQLTLFFFLHTLCLSVLFLTFLMFFTPGSPYITILSAVLL